MAEQATIDLANIDQQLQQAVNQVSASGSAVLDILPKVQQAQQQVNESYNTQMTMMEDTVIASGERVMDLNEKALLAASHPLNVIFDPKTVDLLATIGVVNDDTSLIKLQQKAQRESLNIKRVEQQATTLTNRKTRAQEIIAQPLANALQGVQTSQAVLGAQQQAFQTRSALIAKQVAEVSQAVEGADIGQLRAAINAKNPKLIHPNAGMGDLADALVKKSNAKVSLEQAQLAYQQTGVNLTRDQLKLQQESKADLAGSQSSAFYQQHLQAAQASEKAGKPYKINGVPFSAAELQTAYVNKSKVEKTEAETMVAQGMEMATINEQTAQTGAELTRIVSTNVNNGIPLPTDVRDINVSTLPGHMQAPIKEAQNMLALADAVPEGVAKQAAMADAQKKADALVKDLVKKTTENLSKPQQAAHTQFYTTGQISDVKIAGDYLAESLMFTPAIRGINDTTVIESAFNSPNEGMNILLRSLSLNYKDELNSSDAGVPVSGVGGTQIFLGGDQKKVDRESRFAKAVDNTYRPAPGQEVAAHTQAMDWWQSAYMAQVAAGLQKEKVAGFEDLYDPKVGVWNIPGQPHATPWEVVKYLRAKGEEMQKAGTVTDPDILFKTFYTELGNKDNLTTFGQQYLTPADPTQASVIGVIFKNNQATVFERGLMALRNDYYSPQGPAAVGAANSARDAAIQANPTFDRLQQLTSGPFPR